MLNSEINIKLDHFDGPLGLLLHLIQKEEMHLKELNLNEITSQYLVYLNKMRELNFDLAGDYLLMASTLIYLKSQNSVQEGDNLDVLNLRQDNFENVITKEEWIKRLEELQKAQRLGKKLWELPKKGHEIFTRPKINRQTIVNSILSPVEKDSLIEAMIDFIRREARKYKVIKRDRLSIKEKLETLKSKLQMGVQTSFESLIPETPTIDDLVITFISILELARLKKLDIFQNENDSTIYVNVIGDLNDFDVSTATGFDEE